MPISVRAGTDIGCPTPKIVVDSGSMVDCGYWGPPDQPPSPDPPRKWDAWGCRFGRGWRRWGAGPSWGARVSGGARGVGRLGGYPRRPAPCDRYAGLSGAATGERPAEAGRW